MDAVNPITLTAHQTSSPGPVQMGVFMVVLEHYLQDTAFIFNHLRLASNLLLY
jgi:hypothetical protein